jgi:transcriptional regulator with XRE-family HTH domain
MIRRLSAPRTDPARETWEGATEVLEGKELARFAFTKHPDYSGPVEERSSSITDGGSPAAGRPDTGTALMILRTYRGLTQKRLAEIARINKSTLSSYERGQRGLGGTNLERLLEAMELPLRAWESTLRHVRWLEWLTAGPADRSTGPESDPPPSGEVTDRALSGRTETGEDLQHEIQRIAELAGREREMKVARVLELMARFLE